MLFWAFLKQLNPTQMTIETRTTEVAEEEAEVIGVEAAKMIETKIFK